MKFYFVSFRVPEYGVHCAVVIANSYDEAEKMAKGDEDYLETMFIHMLDPEDYQFPCAIRVIKYIE